MRDTRYATEIQSASLRWPDSDSEARIEHLYIKSSGEHEIRFSWWKNGRMTPRPLDLSEKDLVKLFRSAVRNGVFTDKFKTALATSLTS
jgi:hypothetical protein